MSKEDKHAMFGYEDPFIAYQNKTPHYMVDSYAAALVRGNTVNKESHEYMASQFSKPPPAQCPKIIWYSNTPIKTSTPNPSNHNNNSNKSPKNHNTTPKPQKTSNSTATSSTATASYFGNSTPVITSPDIRSMIDRLSKSVADANDTIKLLEAQINEQKSYTDLLVNRIEQQDRIHQNTTLRNLHKERNIFLGMRNIIINTKGSKQSIQEMDNIIGQTNSDLHHHIETMENNHNNNYNKRLRESASPESETPQMTSSDISPHAASGSNNCATNSPMSHIVVSAS